MSYVRSGLSWALYWMGDGVSRVLGVAGWLYPVYNRLMVWSVLLDREGRVWVPAPR